MPCETTEGCPCERATICRRCGEQLCTPEQRDDHVHVKIDVHYRLDGEAYCMDCWSGHSTEIKQDKERICRIRSKTSPNINEYLL